MKYFSKNTEFFTYKKVIICFLIKNSEIFNKIKNFFKNIIIYLLTITLFLHIFNKMR